MVAKLEVRDLQTEKREEQPESDVTCHFCWDSFLLCNSWSCNVIGVYRLMHSIEIARIIPALGLIWLHLSYREHHLVLVENAARIFQTVSSSLLLQSPSEWHPHWQQLGLLRLQPL